MCHDVSLWFFLGIRTKESFTLFCHCLIVQPAHLRKPVLWRSEHGEVNLWINTTVALHTELLGIGKACRPSGQTKEKCLRLRNCFRFEHVLLRQTLHLDAFGTAQRQPRNFQDESNAVLLDEDAVDPNQNWWITSTTFWGIICFQPRPVVSVWDNLKKSSFFCVSRISKDWPNKHLGKNPTRVKRTR